MKKVLIDTNVLLSIFRFKIDIFSELNRVLDEKYEIYIVEKTIEELKYVYKSHKKLKERLFAKMALEYLEMNKEKIKIIKSEKPVDKAILEISLSNPKEWIVLTGDKSLKEKLRKKGVRIIEIRQKKYLELKW